MKILVLNGSPKGDMSITLQTVLFLQKRFPDDAFVVLNVGQRIKALERDFSPAAEALADADVILFAYPVYTFVVPSQLHRFIELMKEHAEVCLKGKYATQITTSKHFYDTTAHKFIEENCADMGLKVVRGLSADMEDLLSEQGRADAVAFWNFFRFCYANIIAPTAQTIPLAVASAEPAAATVATAAPTPSAGSPTATPAPTAIPLKQYDTVIVTDCPPEELAAENSTSNLVRMIREFRGIYQNPTRVVNLREFHFNGGCLGCFKCAVTGKCAHKDGFDTFLREQIQKADATVYAFTIRDHSMGSLFKMYDDRQFCNGHRTVTMGSPVGYIVDGNLGAEENLRTIMEARADVGHNFYAGAAASDSAASDTDSAASEIGLRNLALTLDYALQHKLLMPQMFYGVGGRKIFRDLIYVMRGLMKADHKFYKKHGFYDDLPNRQKKKILTMQLLGLLMRNPKVAASGKMNEGMLRPYRKVT